MLQRANLRIVLRVLAWIIASEQASADMQYVVASLSAELGRLEVLATWVADAS
jgi:hypothetical protein